VFVFFCSIFQFTELPFHLICFCSGASLRLHVLEEEHDQHSWTSAPGNINLEHWASSTPIDAFPFRHGFYDVIGNVWQWTETPIDEFAGFKVHPVYDDFSAPTFDTRHNLIKGGSWISTGNEATFLARFAFRRHFFQHAGFRYIESNAPIYFRPDTVERDPKVAVAVEAHFGPDYLNVPNFSAALASLVGARTKALGKPTGRVMDMGCGAGRATFELARHFTYSLGLDFSTRFFRVAVDLKARGLVHCSLPEEGDRTVDVCRVISEVAPHITADVMDRSEFLQGDACNLDQRYKAFDVVVAANLLEHCYAPRNFLNEIHRRINYGGLLVIASTYAWDESVTPRAEWLGGTVGSEPSAEIVKRLLVDSGHFVHLANESCQLPMVLREQARKFSHTLSHVMFFERCE
jgi:putative 4-mercaptohistidine N1-methyltranferase